MSGLKIPDIDCYAILEIFQSADAEEIKRAYRRLSLVRHPDKNPGSPGAHDAFCNLNDAFEALSDSTRRALYDARYSTIRSKYESEARERTKRASDLAEAERLRKEQEQWRTVKARRIVEEQTEQKELKRIQEELLKAHEQVRQVEQTTRKLNAERNAPQGWWDYFSVLGKSTEAREADKTKRELGILQSLARERVKLAIYKRDEERLEQQQRAQKELMLRTEKQFQLRMEKETRDQQEREAFARKKEAQERRVREEQEHKREQERRAREEEELKRQQEYWASWTQRQEKARKAERERTEREQAKAQEAAERAARERTEKERQRAAEMRAATARAREKASNQRAYETPVNRGSYEPRNSSCKHSKYWPKVSGQHRCTVCSQTFHSFILQCPDCQCMACASCRKTLRYHG